MTIAADTVALNIIFEVLLFIVLYIDSDERVAYSKKKHVQFKTRIQEPYSI